VASLLGILASNYSKVGSTIPSKTPYVAVDPAKYQGDWNGKYGNGDSFRITVSNVTGFRAKVRYQSGSSLNYQDVLIRDGSFRIGDSRFTLAGNGKALVKTVVTNPYDGTNSVNSAYATLKS
jgi:hypothetical protein